MTIWNLIVQKIEDDLKKLEKIISCEKGGEK